MFKENHQRKKYPLKRRDIEKARMADEAARRKAMKDKKYEHASLVFAYVVVGMIFLGFFIAPFIDATKRHFAITRGKATWGYVKGGSYGQWCYSEISYVIGKDTLIYYGKYDIYRHHYGDSVMILYDSLKVKNVVVPMGSGNTELGLYKRQAFSYTYNEYDYYKYMAELEELRNKHLRRKRFYYSWFDW